MEKILCGVFLFTFIFSKFIKIEYEIKVLEKEAEISELIKKTKMDSIKKKNSIEKKLLEDSKKLKEQKEEQELEKIETNISVNALVFCSFFFLLLCLVISVVLFFFYSTIDFQNLVVSFIPLNMNISLN